MLNQKKKKMFNFCADDNGKCLSRKWDILENEWNEGIRGDFNTSLCPLFSAEIELIKK